MTSQCLYRVFYRENEKGVDEEDEETIWKDNYVDMPKCIDLSCVIKKEDEIEVQEWMV